MLELVPADFRARAEGALLAAAAGDALGWPQEDRGRRVGKRESEPKLDFTKWRRRNGGRFAAHEEVIAPGEYSDDTQLILALARALRAGAGWWERWTSIELPFWLFYERGGGGATKRAARSWAAGKPPWRGDGRTDYFGAGGNGVAMRTLPHCLRGADSDDFRGVAASVVRDGIATHGHPVALVGALAYAYALWRALRWHRPLEYGALVADTKGAVDTWSSLPADLPTEWQEAANAHSRGEYASLWTSTVTSMVEFLTVVESGMSQGALSVDRETLKQLGAFDSVSGAGTVTAAGAIFLASRYASRPAQGLVAAAFASGADTDTLAGMTGGLLGAINGRDWLDGVAGSLQDHHLIAATAAVAADDRPLEEPRPQELRRLWRTLAETATGAEVVLPDGRRGALQEVLDVPTRTRHEIKSFVIRTDDGQTLYLKKVSRLQRSPHAPGSAPAQAAGNERPRARRRAAVVVEATDFVRSTAFYRDLIGLELTRQTPDFASFGGVVVLVPARSSVRPDDLQLDFHHDAFRSRQPRILVFVAREDVELLRKQLLAASVPVTAVHAEDGRRRFQCLDPDGTVVELREADGS